MTPAETEKHDQFLRLYVAHEEALCGFVRSLVPTRDDARDVMQEVAVVLWRKFEGLSSPDDFRRWAFGVARMECLSLFRDRSRDRMVFADDVLALLAEEAEENADLYEEERVALDACLRKLSPAQRTLLEAAYAPGARIDALAAEAGKTAMSFYKALHRIRLTLMDCTQGALSQEKRV